MLTPHSQTNKLAWDNLPHHWNFTLFYTIWNYGEVYIDPRALQDGTVSIEDIPREVTVHFTPEPPEDALVLLPSPRGWRVKS